MPYDVRTTVLVVDDDADFVTDLAIVLADAGYCVLEACDAQSAYKIMQGPKRVDMVVVNLVLADKSGLEVLHDVRRQKPQLKLLAITQLQDQLHLDVATYMGANVAIRKFPRSPNGHFPAAEWVAQIDTLSRN